MRYLITNWQQLKWTKWLRFPVVFEESAILPANVRDLKWKCWLWGIQETKCPEIYTSRHGSASLFQLWWSVRGAVPTFDVNRCSLPGSMFCLCLLRLGLAVTGAPAENFRTRIHGVGGNVEKAYRRVCQRTETSVVSVQRCLPIWAKKVRYFYTGYISPFFLLRQLCLLV